MRVVVGGFFGGDRVALSPSAALPRRRDVQRRAALVATTTSTCRAARFETNLGRLRLSYSFTPRIFVQALVQYNDRDDAWATNLRFGWLQAANTGLFVVYNEIREIGSVPERRPGSSDQSGLATTLEEVSAPAVLPVKPRCVSEDGAVREHESNGPTCIFAGRVPRDTH